MVYAPGTQETDPKKQNRSLQANAAATAANTTNIASNTTNIATNTANIATNTASIATISGDYASKTANNSLAGTQTFTNSTEATGLGTTASALFAGGMEIAKKLFAAGVATFTNATASTTTGTGGVVLSGGLGVAGRGNFGGNLAAPSVTPNAAPGTAWGIDCQACTIAVSASSNSVLSDGSGLIMLSDGTNTGDTGLYLVGGSAAALVSQSTGTSYVTPTTTPAASKYCVAFNGTHYAIYNGNTTTTITFTVVMIRTRVGI